LTESEGLLNSLYQLKLKFKFSLHRSLALADTQSKKRNYLTYTQHKTPRLASMES